MMKKLQINVRIFVLIFYVFILSIVVIAQGQKQPIKDANIFPYENVDAKTISKIDNLFFLQSEQRELRKLQKQLGDAFPPDKQERLDLLSTDITVAHRQFEGALTLLSKADASVKDQIAGIQSERNLQSALSELGKELNTGAVALYTVIGTKEEKDERGSPVRDQTRLKSGWIILVTSGIRKAYPIDITNLEELVVQFRAALSSDRYDPQPLAEKIYTAIFRQSTVRQKRTLENDLETYFKDYKDKSLMWSLNSILRNIPIATLHDGKHYLVEKYRNVIFTRESLVWLMNVPQRNGKIAGFGVSEKRENFAILPGVERELKDIIRTSNSNFGLFEGTININNKFTKKLFLETLRGEKYSVIHIASHYVYDPNNEVSSYLLLGDGRFNFFDYKTENNLFGNVDLIILSACETNGNGGLPYILQSLGAKSVIASLWKVSDAGTPELMIRFYKLRAENPAMSKGEAFRQAQISLLNGTDKTSDSLAKRAELVYQDPHKLNLPMFPKNDKNPFAHPHFWSSFVLIGNWR